MFNKYGMWSDWDESLGDSCGLSDEEMEFHILIDIMELNHAIIRKDAYLEDLKHQLAVDIDLYESALGVPYELISRSDAIILLMGLFKNRIDATFGDDIQEKLEDVLEGRQNPKK